MAISPEIERPPQVVEEIPDNPQVPPELEQGISSVPSHHTNIPQVTDDPAGQITAFPPQQNPSGPSIVLPADPEELTKASQGGVEEASTWNAWYWLRMMKKAVANQISVLVKGKDA
jgi:hypothetical protein